MSEQPGRIWRLVDPATGNFEDYAGCPECGDKDDVIHQLERQVRTLSGRLTRMERNREDDAKKHKSWAEAEAVHEWWAIATGHPGVQFNAEAFHQALPRLREVGPVGLLHAIAGAAYDPGTKRMKNGRLQRFDDWELLCRSDSKLRGFVDRAPGEEGTEQWKRWLVDHIESNLKEEET